MLKAQYVKHYTYPTEALAQSQVSGNTERTLPTGSSEFIAGATSSGCPIFMVPVMVPVMAPKYAA